MCAICGIYRPGGAVPAARVEQMRDLMPFRGPDASGLSVGGDWGLGHRRLAIIDLSESANQPMANEDGSVEVILNGEIYNFAALRPELERAGHRFRSRADTEVLVHGFEEWGLGGLLQRIRGMFAFAILDKARGDLHLARDPLGKKPLFFRHDPNELLFASSARALVAALAQPPPVDVTAVHDLLWHLYVPGPRTIFEGVEKLPGGHAITFSRSGARHELTYWRADFSRPLEGLDEEEWLDAIERALTLAVERRLVSDVPLGVMLSGGVDSSLVTAIAAKVAGRVKTFSVASDDKTIDESRWAHLVAEHCRTDHHVLVVDEDVREFLPQLVAAMGEPLGDASAANLFAISRVARRHVTVALTGDGGDEVFGGYPYFLAFHLTQAWRSLVGGSARPVALLAARALQRLPPPFRRAGTALRLAAATPEQFFENFGRNLDESARWSLFSPATMARLGDHDPAAHYRAALAGARAARVVDRIMEAQMPTLLEDDYLAKADVGTMAASLEGRAPLLDVDLVDIAMRIPAPVRFRGNEPKGLLRALARRHVPAAAIDRAKQGFVAPVGAWLRGPWRDLVDDVVLGPSIERRGWFERDGVQAVVSAQRAGRGQDYVVWTLLVLELWLQATLDGADAGRTSERRQAAEVFAR
jgi:asparagine synthase (glutamine-hydrolysing)